MRHDIEELRRQTPGTSRVLHFNNAGAALQPAAVSTAVQKHLQLEQHMGGYEAAAAASAAIEHFHTAFATLLNCRAEEIAWAENSTHAWNTLLHAIAFKPGDRIVTGQSEYASNYLSLLHLAQRCQVHVDVVPNTGQGTLCLEALDKALQHHDVRLLALTHVPSQSGVVHPAAQAGAIARARGILYLLDACQSAGQLALDVEALGCDMLTGSGRKYLRGPRGTGFLYVRRDILENLQPAWIDLQAARFVDATHYSLREDARRFENWECFVAGKIGLAVAVDYANALGMPWIEARIRELAARLRDRLRELPGISVHEEGSGLCGIVTFSSRRETADGLQQRLLARGINTSVVRLRNNPLDLGKRGLGDLNRASVHYYNTDAEIEQFCDSLRAP
jgi:cysteine desulfurase/selenocysteine lyase